MKAFLQKLTSRKFLAAVAGFVAGLAMAFGLDESIIASVSGAVVSVVSLVTYIVTEGKIDAAAVGNTVQAVQDAVQTIKDAGDLAHIENARLLFSELQGLVDANGKVTAANKERAEFIIGVLNEALGLELSMTGNQIKGYQDLKKSVEEAINAKQADVPDIDGAELPGGAGAGGDNE